MREELDKPPMQMLQLPNINLLVCIFIMPLLAVPDEL